MLHEFTTYDGRQVFIEGSRVTQVFAMLRVGAEPVTAEIHLDTKEIVFVCGEASKVKEQLECRSSQS